MKTHSVKIDIYAVLLISIVAFGFIPQATWAGESLRIFQTNNPSYKSTTNPSDSWELSEEEFTELYGE